MLIYINPYYRSIVLYTATFEGQSKFEIFNNKISYCQFNVYLSVLDLVGNLLFQDNKLDYYYYFTFLC